MSAADWLQLLLYFCSISLLAVGGTIALAPDMHRYLVLQQQWLTEQQFSTAITLAQVAPGPNLLFVAVMGWNVGLNAGPPAGWLAMLAPFGAALCLVGVLAPSSTLTWLVTRWATRNRDRRSVRAFRQGMAPIVVGLLLATAWLLARVQGDPRTDWQPWLLALVTALLVWRTRRAPLWWLGAGALLGGLGGLGS